MKVRPPRDLMRGTMALLLLAGFMTGLFWVIRWAVPEANQQLVTYMLGQLSVLAGFPVAYYFQTSKSSSDKNALLLPPPQPMLASPEPQPVVVTNRPGDPVPVMELDESMEAER